MDSFADVEKPGLSRDNSGFIKDEGQGMQGRSASQLILRSKPSELLSNNPVHKTLAFDLQNLQSQTSMISPKASEAGKSIKNITSFMANREKFKKPFFSKTPKSIYSRKSSRSHSEISKSPLRSPPPLSPAKRKSTFSTGQKKESLLRKWIMELVNFAVVDRLRR